MADIRQVLYDVQETEQRLVAMLWQDVQANAKLLGIEEYSWEITERDLDNNSTSYHALYQVCRNDRIVIVFNHQSWQQEYNAVGPHCYFGQVEISLGFMSTRIESINAFSTLCFGSYYRIIAELYPEFTTHYIDSPKEAL